MVSAEALKVCLLACVFLFAHDRMLMQGSAKWLDQVFDVLSDSLRMFSLDLVKLISGYLVFPCATAGATPKLLLAFGWARPTAVVSALRSALATRFG